MAIEQDEDGDGLLWGDDGATDESSELQDKGTFSYHSI